MSFQMMGSRHYLYPCFHLSSLSSTPLVSEHFLVSCWHNIPASLLPPPLPLSLPSSPCIMAGLSHLWCNTQLVTTALKCRHPCGEGEGGTSQVRHSMCDREERLLVLLGAWACVRVPYCAGGSECVIEWLSMYITHCCWVLYTLLPWGWEVR